MIPKVTGTRKMNITETFLIGAMNLKEKKTI